MHVSVEFVSLNSAPDKPIRNTDYSLKLGQILLHSVASSNKCKKNSPEKSLTGSNPATIQKSRFLFEQTNGPLKNCKFVNLHFRVIPKISEKEREREK